MQRVCTGALSSTRYPSSPPARREEQMDPAPSDAPMKDVRCFVVVHTTHAADFFEEVIAPRFSDCCYWLQTNPPRGRSRLTVDAIPVVRRPRELHRVKRMSLLTCFIGLKQAIIAYSTRSIAVFSWNAVLQCLPEYLTYNKARPCR